MLSLAEKAKRSRHKRQKLSMWVRRVVSTLYQRDFAGKSMFHGSLIRRQKSRKDGPTFRSISLGTISAVTAWHVMFQKHNTTASTLCQEAKNGISDDEDKDKSSVTWGRGDKSLKQIMDEHRDGKENWPWVWCHRNENGPLYVFSGVNKDTLCKCQQVAAANSNYNLLLIATQEEIERHGFTEKDFYKCRCGVHPGPIAELDLCNDILMLEDERIVEFDNLEIV